MKILQVNCVYKKGSTGKITYDIHKCLIDKKIESIVCYGRGTKIIESGVYKTSGEIIAKINKVLSCAKGIMYGGCFFSTNKLIRIIKKENPDIVHLQCINGNFVDIYRILTFLKKNKIKTVLTLHAEFMFTANCTHSFDCIKWKTGCGNCSTQTPVRSYWLDRSKISWKKMKKAFENFNNISIVSVSPWLRKRAEMSPFLSDKKQYTVLNGIDTQNIFKFCDFNNFKKSLNLKTEKLILYVTPIFTSPLKGGKYILELAERLKNDYIKILIVGNTDKSIEFPSNIMDIGRIENQNDLAMYYSMADITVLTSKRETFSMICAESLSCGTPVVGFKAGAPEQISLPEYSEFVEYDDIDKLEKSIRCWLNKKIDKMTVSDLAGNFYSNEKMCDEYINIYNEIYEKEVNI